MSGEERRDGSEERVVARRGNRHRAGGGADCAGDSLRRLVRAPDNSALRPASGGAHRDADDCARADGYFHPDAFADGYPYAHANGDGHFHADANTHGDGYLHPDANGDRHTYAYPDGDIYPDADPNGNPYAHADGYIHPNALADANNHAHADGYIHRYAFADGDSYADHHADADYSPQTHAGAFAHPVQRRNPR